MKRLLWLTLIVLPVLPAARADDGSCCGRGVHCVTPPAPPCPDCDCPCDRGLHLCGPWKARRACDLAGRLADGDCCERLRAAQKLGSRLHADFCCSPEVLPALLRAIQCDSCWGVRRAAAWSVALQRAHTPEAVLALYLASKLDPHYLVRAKAQEALEVLLVCRKGCFKDVFATGDELAKQLKGKYKPGSGECIDLGQCSAACPTGH